MAFPIFLWSFKLYGLVIDWAPAWVGKDWIWGWRFVLNGLVPCPDRMLLFPSFRGGFLGLDVDENLSPQ